MYSGRIFDSQMVLFNAGRIVDRAWRDLPKRYPGIQLDAFVVMPNHVHGVITLVDNTWKVSEIVRGSSRFLPEKSISSRMVPGNPSGREIITSILSGMKPNSKRSWIILKPILRTGKKIKKTKSTINGFITSRLCP